MATNKTLRVPPQNVRVCCGNQVKVTGRPSRIAYRPIRQHQCSCGNIHQIDARTYREVYAPE